MEGINDSTEIMTHFDHEGGPVGLVRCLQNVLGTYGR